MPNLTATLQLKSTGVASGRNSTYSISRRFEHVFDQTFKVENNVVRLFEVDPADGTIKADISVPSKVPSLKMQNFNFLKICNVGLQPLEFGLAIPDASTSTDVFTDLAGLSNTPQVLWMVLKAGEYFILPTSRFFIYNKVDADTTVDYTPGMGNGDGKSGSTKSVGSKLSFTATGTGIFVDTVYVTHGSTITAATTTITTTADGTNAFRVNDVIAIGSEALLITAIANGTSMTVERGYRGTTAADIGAGTEIKFYLRQRTGDTDVITDKKGSFYCNTFFGYGRRASEPTGIVPGSTAIRFYSIGGYQTFGLSDIRPSTKTGLVASTTYKFGMQIDGSSQTDSTADVTITTDATNSTFGGANGLISKIQAALDQDYFDSTKDMFDKRVTIAIIDTDVRITSHSNLSTTKVVLRAPSTGTTPFGVGRIPAIGSLPATVTSRVPDAETEQNHILFDNGDGTMSRKAGGSASINYETGEIHIAGCPRNAHMEIAGMFSNALSGHIRGDKDNHVFSGYAKSLSQYRDAHIRIIGFTSGRDDSVTYKLPAKARY